MIIAGLYNRDNSFFEIKSPDISKEIPARVMMQDVKSFTYVEEMGMMGSGCLSLRDPDHIYSKILRKGLKLNISFGYVKPDTSMQATFLMKANKEQVFGANSRTGINAYVMSPDGNGSADGDVTYNCNFYSNEYLDEKQTRILTGMSKGDLVYQLLTEIGCDTMFVNFTRQKELLNENTQIIQRETNYKLLCKYAREWRAMFRISFNAKGRMTAVFISPENISNPQIAPLMAGAIGGNSIYLEYRQGVSNVIDYNWKNHEGDAGNGDNVRIVYGKGGQPTFIRYVTEGEKVKAYKLNTGRIRNKLMAVDGFANKIALEKEFLSVTDFEQVKWAFDPIEETTAPQGLGYSLNARILGNPMISPPLVALFGEGFPVWFTPANSKTHVINYFCKKVTHTINMSGYINNLEIQDAFTMFGGSLI